jgi:hypothetical protein
MLPTVHNSRRINAIRRLDMVVIDAENIRDTIKGLTSPLPSYYL